MVFHQPARLRIMGLVYKHRDVAFTRVRDLLGLTDGNLASHANRLAEAGYLEARRVLERHGFELRYRITAEGSRAFREYLATLRGFLDAVEEEAPAASTKDGAPVWADPM